MQDTRSNQLIPDELSEEMRKRFLSEDPAGAEDEIRREFDATGKVKAKDQGPIFIEGQVYPIQGYGYELVRIKRNGLVFKPHGPLKVVERAKKIATEEIKRVREKIEGGP